MLELEVKVKVDYESLRRIREILRNISLSHKTIKQEDHIMSLKPDEQKFVKIRIENERRKVIVIVKRKVKSKFKVHSEKEFHFDNIKPEILINLFKELGYEEKLIVSKVREEYMLSDSIKACIDEVEGLGTFLEVEVISKDLKEGREKLERIIEYILSKAGIKHYRVINKSYIEMLLEEKMGDEGLNTDGYDDVFAP